MYHISNDKRSKESSQWIYNSLVELMETTNYSDITITKICQKAKVGRVTFYRHYDGIDDVLLKKCDEEFYHLQQYCKDYYRVNPQEDPILKPFLHYWYKDSKIIELILKAEKPSILISCFDAILASIISFATQKDNTIIEYQEYFSALGTTVCITILTTWIKNKKDIPPDVLSNMVMQKMRDSATGILLG